MFNMELLEKYTSKDYSKEPKEYLVDDFMNVIYELGEHDGIFGREDTAELMRSYIGHLRDEILDRMV